MLTIKDNSIYSNKEYIGYINHEGGKMIARYYDCNNPGYSAIIDSPFNLTNFTDKKVAAKEVFKHFKASLAKRLKELNILKRKAL